MREFFIDKEITDELASSVMQFANSVDADESAGEAVFMVNSNGGNP